MDHISQVVLLSTSTLAFVLCVRKIKVIFTSKTDEAVWYSVKSMDSWYEINFGLNLGLFYQMCDLEQVSLDL